MSYLRAWLTVSHYCNWYRYVECYRRRSCSNISHNIVHVKTHTHIQMMQLKLWSGRMLARFATCDSMDMCVVCAWHVSLSAANIMRRRHQLLPVALLLPRLKPRHRVSWEIWLEHSNLPSAFKRTGCVNQLIMGACASGIAANWPSRQCRS